MGCKKLAYYQYENHSLWAVWKNPAPFPEQVAAGKSQEKTAIDYYPFGMMMPGRTYNPTEYEFGFQSQMKVDEIAGVGNHYTATFWEYDPRTGRRWNVDPVVKAWESSYAVLSNNPITRIDPLGNTDDDYKVDKQGKVELIKKTDDKNDVLYATNDNGNVDQSKSIQVDKGVLGNSKTNTVTGSNGKDYTFNQYSIKGDDKAKGLFEFVSTNTNVEWSLTGIGAKEGAEGNSILTTSRKKDSEIGGGYLLSRDYTIRGHAHSHPYNQFPSPADKGFATSLNTKFPKAKLEIFHAGKYSEYNKNGLIYTLPVFEIKSK